MCAFVVTQNNCEQNWAILENTYSDDEVNIFLIAQPQPSTVVHEFASTHLLPLESDPQASGFPGKASLYMQPY